MVRAFTPTLPPHGLAVVVCAVLLGGGVQAQSIGEPIPGLKESGPRRLPPAQAARGARPCPEYGPGFVRLEGSTACVRVGGSVRVDFGKRTRSDFGSAARAGVYLDTRGTVGSLPFRAVVSGQVQTESDGWRHPLR